MQYSRNCSFYLSPYSLRGWIAASASGGEFTLTGRRSKRDFFLFNMATEVYSMRHKTKIFWPYKKSISEDKITLIEDDILWIQLVEMDLHCYTNDAGNDEQRKEFQIPDVP